MPGHDAALTKEAVAVRLHIVGSRPLSLFPPLADPYFVATLARGQKK